MKVSYSSNRFSFKRIVKWFSLGLFLVIWLFWDINQAQGDSSGLYTSFSKASDSALKSPAATTVAIVRSNDAELENPVDVTTDGIPYETVEQMVRRAVELTGGLTRIIKSGDTVLIKPNLVQMDSSGSGGITDVRVVKALVKMVDEIDHGKILIIVGDGSPRPFTTFEKASGTSYAPWVELFDVSGYQILKAEMLAAGVNFRISNLNGNSDTDPWPELDSAVVPCGGQAQPQNGAYFVHKDVTTASVYISVPVMKIHEQPGFTCALKNQIGIAASSRYGYNKMAGVVQENRTHKLLHQAQLPYNWQDKEIVDLSSIARIKFVVVDAITCMETRKSPVYDPADRSNKKIANRVVMNSIIAGDDPVAVDNVCCRIMGLNPDDIEHITLAERAGLGTNNPDSITVAGTSIEQIKRRFKKSQQASGIYGQSNRIWMMNGPYNAADTSDPMNAEFIAGESTVAPAAGANNWSEPIYFNDDQIMLKEYYKSSIGPEDKVVSYAFTYIYSPSACQAELWIGSDEAIKVYLNGDVVYNFAGSRIFMGTSFYNTAASLNLVQGRNTLLVKAYQSAGAYNFSLNICEVETDANYKGNRVPGLKFSTNDIATTIKHADNPQPEMFTLNNCYPNPFNPATTIKYQIKNSEHVSLKIYDISGREIAVLVDGIQTAGVHSVQFNANNSSGMFASGVYFYKLSAANSSSVKKMVLIK